MPDITLITDPYKSRPVSIHAMTEAAISAWEHGACSLKALAEAVQRKLESLNKEQK